MTGERDPWALSGQYGQATHDDWRASVDAVLSRRRGDLGPDELAGLFDKVLTSTTDDGIVLQPLYRADEHSGAAGLPGQPPFVRGSSASGALPSGWDVRQRVVARAQPEDTSAAILTELENGATSLWLDLDGQAPSADTLDAMLTGVLLDLVPLVVSPGPAATDSAAALLQLWRRRDVDPSAARGVLGFDPLGRFAASGGVEDAEIGLAAAAEVARTVTAEFPAVATLVADGSTYHDAGASEADELALALATATAYLRTLRTAGLDPDAAVRQIEFRLAATDNQFLSIAKLRAARRVWSRVAEVTGASAQAGAQRQHAVSSRAMLTRYDPWVNLLRTTVAGFAAGVAGASAVTIAPHDLLLPSSDPDDGLGARLARNVQSILIEESHLARVIDPAGGAWFVEQLTDDLAERAWARFQQVEAAGGLAAALNAGLPQRWLAETRTARGTRIRHRRQPITGVSEFPNPGDSAAPLPSPGPGPTPFPAVTPHFYAAEFEHLRDRAAAHAAAAGSAPTVFLATLGPLAEHTARASYCSNLFAAGGLATATAGTVTADTAAEALQDSGASLVCLCGSDDRYAAEAAAVVQALKSASSAGVLVAGDPGDLRAALDEAGVDSYVVAGDDAVDLLDRALTMAGAQ